MLAFSIIAALAATAAAPDAPVRYGTINCRHFQDSPYKDCQVAFVSRGQAKLAAYVTAPDGKVRIIHFRGGQPSSTDAGSQLHFERKGGALVISVGKAEMYEFPDRLVTGK